MAESYITDSMMDVFLYESEQMLEQLENIALECEKSKEMSDANVNEIFRIMHTIKGSSGVMMFTDITTCSHTLEDVFYYIRESKPTNIPLDELVGLMLEVDDFIKGELEKIKSGQKATLQLTLDTSKCDYGVWVDRIKIITNDPTRPMQTMRVTAIIID